MILASEQRIVKPLSKKRGENMSKKDYRAIADAIKQARQKYPQATEAYNAIVDAIAVVLKKDNPRFDYERFLDYLGTQCFYRSLASFLARESRDATNFCQNSNQAEFCQAIPKMGGDTLALHLSYAWQGYDCHR